MKRAASTFFLAVTVSVISISAQTTGNTSESKPATDACPSWNKKQPSKADYFAYLRKRPVANQNGPSNTYITNKATAYTSGSTRTNNERNVPQNNFRTEPRNMSATRLTEPEQQPAKIKNQDEDQATAAVPVKTKKENEPVVAPEKKEIVPEEKKEEKEKALETTAAKSGTLASAAKADKTVVKKKTSVKKDKGVRMKKTKFKKNRATKCPDF